MGIYRSVLTQTDFEVDFSFAVKPKANESVREHSLAVGCTKPIDRSAMRSHHRKSGDSHARSAGLRRSLGCAAAFT